MNTNNEELKTRLETDLLAIIKEGQNLREGEYTELTGGVRVKSDRVREFERLCDNYYELEFNQVIGNDTDTITPVYQKLTKLVETENEEFYISKASDFVLEVKSEVERFKALTKSFNTVDSAYKLTVRELNDLYLKRENTQEWQQRVTELNNEVRRLNENSAILTEQILAARRNVNESLIKYAEEQMAVIRDSFLKTSKEADREAAMDHNFVLASDRLEYDSLYRLVLILRQANTINDFEKLVCLDDMMFVTNDQKDVLVDILPNIKLYGYIKAPEKKETSSLKDKNNEFIAKIQKAMDILKENSGAVLTNNGLSLTTEAATEYDKLLEILKIINKANNSDFTLVDVWGEVSVLAEDREKLIEIFKSSRIFKGINPDTERVEQNEKLIQELYAYLDELASKVTSYTGVANLPIKSTNAIGDRAWVVTERDFEEANRIIEIIKLLQNQTTNLIPVWDIANISSNDIAKFKRLANATRRFGDKAPKIPENEEEMKNILEELKNLIKKAKETENAVLAANGLVLESDLSLYKLLEEKHKYLDASKASDTLIEVDGVLIDSNYVDRYKEINEQIKALMNPKVEEAKATEEVEPEVKEQVQEYQPIPDDKALVPIMVEPIEVPNIDNAQKNDEEDSRIKPYSAEGADFSANDKQIAKLKERLAELSAKSSHNEQERKEFDLLQEQIDLLEHAKTSKNLVSIAGVLLDSDDVEKYLKSLTEMDDLLTYGVKEDEAEDMSTKKGKRTKSSEKRTSGIKNKLAGLKKITAVRKLGNTKFGKFVRENWKQIIALGIATVAVIYFLPQLVPTIIFANSCNAAAIPALSGVFNAISSAIAPLAGISFVPGMGAINLGVSANLAGPALIEALSKLGIVTIAGFTINKDLKQIINKDEENRLSDPQRKSIVQKISDVTSSLNFDNLEHNPDLSPAGLINAQIEYDVNQENLTDEGKTLDEMLEENISEDASEILAKEKKVEEISAPEASASSSQHEELSDEERKRRGEEIIKLQKQRLEEIKKARAAKAAEAAAETPEVEDVADTEELRKIQERAAEFTNQVNSEEVAAVVPDSTEAEAAKVVPEELPKPVVEVPSAEEVISQLSGEAPVVEEKNQTPQVSEQPRDVNKMLKDLQQSGISISAADAEWLRLGEPATPVVEPQEILSEPEPEVLDVEPPKAKTSKTARVLNLLNRPVDSASKTSQVIGSIVDGSQGQPVQEAEVVTDSLDDETKKLIAEKENEIKKLQAVLDNTKSPQMKLAYENAIKALNDQIEEWRGRGR